MSKFDKLYKFVLSDAGFVFVASLMASGFSFLTSLIMARILSREDQGIYGSYMNLFNYTVLLGSTIQTGAARTVAQQQVRSGIKGVKDFYWPAFSGLVKLGIILFFVLAALSIPISNFLHVDVWLVLTVFTCVIFFGPASMTTGVLQGLQSFRLFGTSLNIQAIARLLMSIVLVLIGLKYWGAAVALPFSMLITLATNMLLVYWAERHHTAKQNKLAAEILASGEVPIISESELHRHPLRAFFTTSFFALFGLMSFSVMTNLDVILVRHFFSNTSAQAAEAGDYAVASLLGKIVLYFAAPIALVALPKMSHAHEKGENVVAIFRRNFWLTIAASLLPLVILLCGSGFIVKIFSPKFPSSELLLLPFYGLAMLLYNVVTLWIYFFVAVGKGRYMFAVLGAAILEVGLLFAFHSELSQIILMITIPAAVLLIVGEIELFLYRKQQPPTQPQNHPPTMPTANEIADVAEVVIEK